MDKSKVGYNLFLDDIRTPKEAGIYCFSNREMIHFYENKQWKIVRNFDEFVQTIEQNGLPQIISFDHDLAEEHYQTYDQTVHFDSWEEYNNRSKNFTQKTGLDCAQWLIEYMHKNDLNEYPKIIVHSMNSIGRKRIIELFNNKSFKND